jgi:cystathionine beta-lyase
MKYNFDQEVSRKGTNSIKWDYVQSESNITRLERTGRFFGRGRSIPMWIADMDFLAPKPVVDALVGRAKHGIFGYSEKPGTYYDAVVQWMGRRHKWKIDREWIVTTPGVVPALAMLVRTFVAPDEKVIIQPPVYYPFYLVAEFNEREIVKNPLIYEKGRYRIDFDDLESQARDPKARMLILCSPHNPVGRVWTKKELTRLGEICLQNNVLVVSDEIHGDLVYSGSRMTPFARINKAFAQHSITCTAPIKTFILAGLSTSNLIIPDADLRKKFRNTLLENALLDVGIFGSIATEVAYQQGAEWLDQLLDYLEGNLDLMEDFIGKYIPRIKMIRPEGTYLVWLDCRGLGLDKDQLKHLMVKKARLYLDEGYIFGAEGEGFERMNIACPRRVLREALVRIRKAVDELK